MNMGEKKCMTFYQKQGYCVIDLTRNDEFFNKDIDFIIRKQGYTQAIEAKQDSVIHRTGNIFVETIDDIAHNSKGWYYYIEADKLFYYDLVKRRAYIFNVGDLRRYIDTHILEERISHDRQKDSKGWLVPVADFKLCYPVEEVSV